MLKTLIFRSVTPVFGFAIGDADVVFNLSGSYEAAAYTLALRRYDLGGDGFNELMAYASPAVRETLRAQGVSLNPQRLSTNYFMVLDVVQSVEERFERSINSGESCRILNAVMDALRLHATKGLMVFNTYLFRHPPQPHDGVSTSFSFVNPLPYSHLGTGDSFLPVSECDPCRRTCEALVNRQWRPTSVCDQVLRLALAYHKTALTLADVEHSFLLLMVAFEALFKKKQEQNVTTAARRFGNLVAGTRAERKAIQDEFCHNGKRSFCELRNDIAHGEPFLDREAIAATYPSLYRHFQKGLIELLSIPVTGLDGPNYYDKLTALAQGRYASRVGGP